MQKTKAFLKTAIKLLNPWLLIFYFLLLIITVVPFEFIPDWFAIGSISGRRDIIMRLLTALTGFASLLLTVLLVGYNIFVKSIRRNTLEYITDNPWLRLIFTLFSCNVLFLFVGYIIAGSRYCNQITSLYIGFTSTIGFILSLFPMAILAVSDSGSLRRINKLVAQIRDEDLFELVNPHFDSDTSGRVHVEHNPLMILRDMAVAGIADRDWVIPQTILSKLYERIILTIEENPGDKKLFAHLNAWAAVCNPIKREIIKQEDDPTAHTFFHLNVSAHKHLALKKALYLRDMPLDNLITDFVKRIIRKNLFTDLQDYIPRYLIEILTSHFLAINYNDEQIPTLHYVSTNRKQFENKSILSPVRQQWFYLTHELPDLVFSCMKEAAEYDRPEFVYLIATNCSHTCEAIIKSSNLTASQKRECLQWIFHSGKNAVEFSVEKGIWDGIFIIHPLYVSGWFAIDKDLGYSAFFTCYDYVQTLYRNNRLSSHLIDEFFEIVRDCFFKSVEEPVMYELVRRTLDLAFRMLDNEKTSAQLKKDIQYEIKLLSDRFFPEFSSAARVVSDYKDRIEKYLADYAGWNEYFQGWRD